MNNRILDPITKKIKLAIGRGVIKRVIDSTKIQKLQLGLYANETRSDVERFQEYGFTSVPLPGASALAVFLGGDRAHGIVLGVEDKRYRVKALQGGEVCIYTDEGDKIHFKRGNKIEVTTSEFIVNASTKMTVNTPVFEVNAGTKAEFNTPIVRASGDIIDNFNTNANNLGNMRDIYDNHDHNENDSGGPTDDPNQKMGA